MQYNHGLRSRSFLIALALCLFLPVTQAVAGGLVFGPETATVDPRIITETATETVSETYFFSVEEDEAEYRLVITNGGSQGKGLVESAVVTVNGEQVVGPEDFAEETFGFIKDVSLQLNNEVSVQITGHGGSSLTVEIRFANPRAAVFNEERDLWISKLSDGVGIWWVEESDAEEYIVFRGSSSDGPWQETDHSPLLNSQDLPPAEEGTLCYRVEAVDRAGMLLRAYDPVCVLQQEPATGPPAGVSKGDEPWNTLCLSDTEFTDTSAMSLDDIKNLLKVELSFLRGQIRDVDDVLIEPAEIIFNAAQAQQINPQVVLTTLQKEHSSITAETRPRDSVLRIIMGYDTPNPTTIRDQIQDATAQLRRDFSRLANGNPTAGGWEVGVPHETVDGFTVTPANKAVAVLFSYTPHVGVRWGGTGGGNFLFCDVWSDFNFDLSAACSNPQTCGQLDTCNPESGCSNPVCTSLTEGGGLCVEGTTPCAGLADCTTSNDCPGNARCLQDTCCGRRVCVTESIFCSAGSGTSLLSPITFGPTIGSR